VVITAHEAVILHQNRTSISTCLIFNLVKYRLDKYLLILASRCLSGLMKLVYLILMTITNELVIPVVLLRKKLGCREEK
jgi:hypothetical protein